MKEKIFYPSPLAPLTGRSGGISIVNHDRIYGFLLCIAVLAAYQPAWNCRPVWDNDHYMTRPALRSPGGFAQIWIKPGTTEQYYPLVDTVFRVEHCLWGDAPPGCNLNEC